MNPLRLTPPQWRILRYLLTYSASAARVGFRADQLGERTSTRLDDLHDLADAEYIAGREHGSAWGPAPDVVHDVTNPRKLNVHLTAPGKKAAELLHAATDALLHLRVYGPLPSDFLQAEIGVPTDVLAQLEQVGYTTTTTSGSYAAWRDGHTVHVYRAVLRVEPSDTCTGCKGRTLAGATVWLNLRTADRYCDPCARRKNRVLVPSPLVTLTKLGRRYSDPGMVEVGSL
ncbi:unnamed protein product [[Actinomadura] parvosata subsp. kistnae]|uniref:Uncharacterized protein n=1 Tax=[Actinomadura] parvosata subsp. kistnae TaxID=1909395 RepID=A0A1V0ABN0_9ACTN|nr:hypothetical protein [Nonomuraea sp. ATCC 55076]AQZ67579.1 hypothetical protein BKM31_44450 [Nonomuraea sp. ATCC 55076]SPL94141.1 unnamed protein product [Actinomadura parvosata subsp. kistnae]